MKTTQTLTDEKFNEIYTNEKFRNEVAFAVSCYDSAHHFKYKKTVSYPDEYIVTDEQIKEANKELQRAKQETYKKYGDSLLFVGMGMTYEPRYEDDVCNHRIRTEFLNSKGKQYFVEFGTGRGNDLRCDFSIDRDKQKELNDSPGQQSKFYNFRGLERKDFAGIKYTQQNILEIVNEYFDCRFTNIVIDNYNIHCNDREIVCRSPKN
jgi:hypothetical protein